MSQVMGPEEEGSRSNAPQKQRTPEVLRTPEGMDPKKLWTPQAMRSRVTSQAMPHGGPIESMRADVRQVAQQLYNSGKQAGQGRARQGRAPSGRGEGRPRTPVLSLIGKW